MDLTPPETGTSFVATTQSKEDTMSEETSQWLNQNTLIGLTAQRGTAWHYRQSDQGDESNHYEGFIPVADVERRLFSWNPGERSVAVVLKGKLDNAVTTYFAEGDYWSVVLVEDRKAITRDDTEDVLGVFKSGYTPHDYRTALVDNVGQILSTSNGDLGIGSAVHRRRGGRAGRASSGCDRVDRAAGHCRGMRTAAGAVGCARRVGLRGARCGRVARGGRHVLAPGA